MTVQVSLDSWDETGNCTEDKALQQWCVEHRPGVPGVSYIIQRRPLAKVEETLPIPTLNQGWCEAFEFRRVT